MEQLVLKRCLKFNSGFGHSRTVPSGQNYNEKDNVVATFSSESLTESDAPICVKTSFSDFIRSAKSKEKKRVYSAVLAEATKQQNLLLIKTKSDSSRTSAGSE